MIQYGSDERTELVFSHIKHRLERRDAQWIDIELRWLLEPHLQAGNWQVLPDFTALVICTHGGQIAQLVPQLDGLDCEYQFTAAEKEQLSAYVEAPQLQAEIRKAAQGQ